MTAEIARVRGELARLERGYGDADKAARASTGGSESFAAGMLKVAGGIGIASAAMSAFSQAADLARKATFDTNASLETATLQFKVLMGDADQASEHVKSLFEFAKATPFESGPIIQASRTLEVFGGAALNTQATLKIVGDAAAGASVGIEEVAQWVARAYSAIQSGRPFGEAAQRLQELGLLSGDARERVEKLAEAGADSERVWAALSTELRRFEGSMKEQESTWQGLTSTASDSINLLLSGALKPLFDQTKEGLASLNAVLASDDAKRWGEDLATSLDRSKTKLDELIDKWEKWRRLNGRSDVGSDAQIPERVESFDPIGALFGMAGRTLDTAGGPGGSVGGFWGQMGPDLAESFGPFLHEFESQQEQVVDSARSFGDRLSAAFDIGAAAEELGSGGAELMKALADGMENNTDLTASKTEQAARKIMDRWLRELDPEIARQRGAELQAALIAGGEEAERLLRRTQTEIDNNKAAEKAQKDAEKQQREQEKVIREAEKIARDAQRAYERELEMVTRVVAERDKANEKLIEIEERRQDAHNVAIQNADEAIQKAIEQADKQVEAAQAAFEKERAIQNERKTLQEALNQAQEGVRERQSLAGIALGDQRGAEDRDRRRGREDLATIEARARALAEAEKSGVDAVNEARFRGDSIATLRAMAQVGQRTKALQDQFAEQDRLRERQREYEEQDAELARERRRQDMETQKANARELLNDPIIAQARQALEAFNTRIVEDSLAERILEFYRARDELIGAANQRLSDTFDTADQRAAAESERVRQARSVSIGQITQNFYGPTDSETLRQAYREIIEEEETAVAAGL